MTRKDFEQIAGFIAAEHASAKSFAEQQAIVRLAQRMCIGFEQRWPRFDPDKFMEACIGY